MEACAQVSGCVGSAAGWWLDDRLMMEATTGEVEADQATTAQTMTPRPNRRNGNRDVRFGFCGTGLFSGAGAPAGAAAAGALRGRFIRGDTAGAGALRGRFWRGEAAGACGSSGAGAIVLLCRAGWKSGISPVADCGSLSRCMAQRMAFR